jgi:leader peptidase (prepilin peptidase)/N-methyltransferase
MAVLVFFAGLVIGALLNIVIIRLPREKRLIGWPRCTRSGESLALWQLLPLAGWLLQRGRAHNGKPIHWIYPLVELLTAVALTLFYQSYGFSVLFFYLSFVSIVLIITGAIDWTHRYIYTFVILGAALLTLLIHAIGIVPEMNLLNAAVGMLISGIFFTMLFILAKFLFPARSVPFGLGDVFLSLFIGAAFGLTRLVSTLTYGVFMAGAVAVLIVSAKHLLHRRVPEYMSYGSYLCLGAIVYLLVQGW